MEAMTRIHLLATQLPAGVAIGGWAALLVRGALELDGTTGPGSRPQPVLVHVRPHGRVRPRPGIIVDRSALSASDIGEVDGLLVTTSIRACFDIMCRNGVEEGLVAADIAARMTGLQPHELARYVVAHRGVAGVPMARQCAPLVDPRAASGPESRLRYVWVVEAGLPRPLVNPTIVDEGGNLLGMPDLLDDAAGLVVEYDGSHHRALRQHTADNIREEAFERAGLTVVRATAIDLWPRRPELIRRMREGHAQGLARDRRRDRWGLRR
jgi:hypothetical protein